MTSTMKCVAFVGLFLSANVLACNAMEDMSAQVIKKTLTPEQIQTSLDKWRSDELSKIDSIPMIQFQHDEAPDGARETLARNSLEAKYNELAYELGLYQSE
ncbi:hypothetical protein [Vibrio parahaemolyticus]|uniref:hypothetical protein n=1 Tax=Vibrio parahaemolyticus TaxID=670 RepID=UPI0004F2B42C|nr:hypothetical protein [Vibrio parahaemolyticus]EJG1926116.1 hypothetical protein [Vibrio parahaemolyticus]